MCGTNCNRGKRCAITAIIASVVIGIVFAVFTLLIAGLNTVGILGAVLVGLLTAIFAFLIVFTLCVTRRPMTCYEDV